MQNQTRVITSACVSLKTPLTDRSANRRATRGRIFNRNANTRATRGRRRRRRSSLRDGASRWRRYMRGSPGKCSTRWPSLSRRRCTARGRAPSDGWKQSWRRASKTRRWLARPRGSRRWKPTPTTRYGAGPPSESTHRFTRCDAMRCDGVLALDDVSAFQPRLVINAILFTGWCRNGLNTDESEGGGGA